MGSLMSKSRKTNSVKLTPYHDINDLLEFFTAKTISALQENLTGIYLTGSLSYEAFNYGSSDLDVTVIVRHPVSPHEIEAIRRLHVQIEEKFSRWAGRFECSYTPREMLSSILPPATPRPWYWGGEGVLYEEAPYGNEWIINNYLLYHHAIPLVGPEFNKLIGPVDIEEVQKACIRDLFKEWEPKRSQEAWFANSHYQSYFILNLCRILYTIMCRTAGSKKAAASWVKGKYGEPWESLINAAEQWHYGLELHLVKQAVAFLDFVIDQISKTALYEQLLDEINDLRTRV